MQKNKLKSTENYLEEVVARYGNKYDYSEIKYINAKEKVIVICKEHGAFQQEASYFVNASLGCPSCSIQNKKSQNSTTEEFIVKANIVHDDKFDYSLVNYINARSKVEIICPMHGMFGQTPNNHLRSRGCNKCRPGKTSSITEKILINFIESLGFTVVSNNRYSWLNDKELDIFIPELNLAIEYNGFAYHHSTVQSTVFFKSTYKDDTYHLDKYNRCKENGVNLIHIFEFEDIEEWKSKLIKYFENPNDFVINYENQFRAIKMYSKTLDFYGISSIIRID